MKRTGVRNIALRDIAKYMKKHKLNAKAWVDNYNIQASHLDTDKSIAKLNRELGLHKINK